MRFINLLDGGAIHNPNLMDAGYVVENPVLKRGANKHGSLSFVMEKTNPMYGELRDRSTWVSVTDGKKELFRGRVMNQRKTLSQKLEVYCEGELGVLCDTIKRPFVYRGSVRGFIEMLIANHNAECPMFPFSVGEVTVTDPNDYIVRESLEPKSTWELIAEKLVKMLGGYIRVRGNNGARTIDYIAQGAMNTGQTLEYGKNLLSLEHYIDAANVATALIPYGAQLEEGDPGYEEKPESGEWNGNRLTIKSVNGGLDWVSNTEGVGNYGLIFDSQTWDDVTTPAALKTKAEAELLDRVLQSVSVKVTAVDLSNIDRGIEPIELLQRVRTYSRPHDLDIWLTCTEVEEPLMNLAKTKFTLGEAGKTMTEIAGRKTGNTVIQGGGGGLPTDPEFNSVKVANGITTKTVSAAGNVSGGSLSTTGTASAKDVTASNKTTTKDLEATGDATVSGLSTVGNSIVKGYSVVEGNQNVAGDNTVGGEQIVVGDQNVYGNAYVAGDITVGEKIIGKDYGDYSNAVPWCMPAVSYTTQKTGGNRFFEVAKSTYAYDSAGAYGYLRLTGRIGGHLGTQTRCFDLDVPLRILTDNIPTLTLRGADPGSAVIGFRIVIDSYGIVHVGFNVSAGVYVHCTFDVLGCQFEPVLSYTTVTGTEISITKSKVEPASGEIITLGPFSVRMVKMNGMVQFTVDGGGPANVSAGGTIGTLPEKYRPLYFTEFASTVGGYRVFIDPSGSVTVTTAINNGYIRGGCTYIGNY